MKAARTTGRSHISTVALTAAIAATAACSGGDSGADAAFGIGLGSVPCEGFCQTNNPQRLEVADVEAVIARGVAEAQARGVAGTIAVVDHVGNVLAVFRMTGAMASVTVTSGQPVPPGGIGGLDGLTFVPDTLAAISKAVTAAYLSAEQTALSTRTASQIVQDHFNPLERNTPAGPLFGVQFSQLPCSDIVRRFNGVDADAGTHRTGIGLAADPGGLPLYKQGTVVGGVGVIADGFYSLDPDITDRDSDLDELIATAATFGFAAPRSVRADRIILDGKTLRFSDADFANLLSDPVSPPVFASLPGALIAVPGYSNAAVIAGTYFGVDTTQPGPAFGTAPSGIRPADPLDPLEAAFAARDGFVVVDELDANRYPAANGASLTQAEVLALLDNGLALADRTRSQVRQPLGDSAGIHITIVDTDGSVLGMARTRDTLLFAIDVATQKARTALFFSSANAAAKLSGVPDAEYTDVALPLTTLRTEPLGQYVTDFRNFLDLPAGLADGAVAWSMRAIGNISRPFFPDGIESGPHGPLSKPPGEWSVFSSGAQLDLAYNAIINHVAFVLGVAPDVGTHCTGIDGFSAGFAVSGQFPELRNGMTVFAGGVPIYKGGALAGAIGTSGDGVEQDNLVAVLALRQTAAALGTISGAPIQMRADQLSANGVNLRWAVCPHAPFLDSDENAPCED